MEKKSRFQYKIICAAILCMAFAAICAGRSYGVTTQVKVAFNCHMAPYQFVDESGRSVGMHIDMFDAIAKDNRLIVEYIPMKKNQDCMDALESGEVDLILGQRIDGRYANQFTNEISSSTLCLLMPQDNTNETETQEELSGKKVVFEYGTASYALISKIGAHMYQAVGSQDEAFLEHIDGNSDAIIGLKDSLLYHIYQAGLEDEYAIINNYMSTVRYGILTQEDDHGLKRMINNGLAALRASGKYDRIYQNWTIEESANNLQVITRRFIYAAVVVLVPICIYIIINQRVKSVLKLQVAKQTQVIQEANAKLEQQIIQIQNANDLQRRLIETASNGMIYFDHDYTIRIMNNSARSLSGIAQDVDDIKLYDVEFFSSILQQMGINISDVFRSGMKPVKRIISMRQNQMLRTYQCSVQQTMDSGGIDGAILTISDITKEEQEKQAAFEKEKNWWPEQFITREKERMNSS